MAIAQYLKEIGRGREGARGLTQAQARDLMEQVLDRRVGEAERGAFAIAMRIKGETTDELAGFTEAAAARCIALPDALPVVLLPSYNGARKLANLTPLLALLLAQEGVPVLVHGTPDDPLRVTTHTLFRTLGLPVAQGTGDVEAAWARQEPAFMPIDALCPPLAELLALRWAIGLRNPGHTVAKLLAPPGAAALRVVSYTHPEYAQAHTAFLQQAGADALLLRGTEGEAVADPRRLPRLDVFLAGTPRPDLGRPAHEGVLSELPLLPRSREAADTAMYVQSVVSGEMPVPGPLREQVEVLLQAWRLLAARTQGCERQA